MKYSRNDYMNKICTHRQYYGQFVSPMIYNRVLKQITLDKLLQSKDEHLNDIPLRRWDNLAYIIREGALAFKVCVLKEAAKQIIEDHNLENK